jgi:hypothetical protein
MAPGTPSRRRPAGGKAGARAAREEMYRRRRRTALAAAAVILILLIWAVASIGGGGSGASADKPAPATLQRGGRVLLPDYRIVAYYGAPQHDELGALGIGTPDEAGRKLLPQAAAYKRPGRPVMPAFELIVTLAQADPGDDGMYRLRQTPAVIQSYLDAVRRIKGVLILDIQPGHASFVDEVRAIGQWLIEPDVELALDPEWNVPEGVVPGKQIGSTDAATVNQISYYLARLRRLRNLPQKVLIVHQFTEGMVTNRDRIRDRPGVAIVHNIDGFGTPDLKTGVYNQLSYRSGAGAAAGRPPGGGRFNGFKLFYKEDTNLMAPAQALGLRPAPDVVVYE